jgi:hypothetical protein
VADSRERIVLVGDLPTPTNPPSGCRFHTRCPRAQEDCVQILPPTEPVLGDPPEHVTACLHPLAAGEQLAGSRPTIGDTQIDDTNLDDLSRGKEASGS